LKKTESEQVSNVSKRYDLLIDLTKIVIIIISGIYLFGNFTPFYEANDSFLYGIESINLSKGIYSISNELLSETGRWEFVGDNWRISVQGDSIPIAGIGTPILGAFFYLVSGIYGLFYLGPILGILFLIIFERFSTKLFGKYVGLLSLIFLATCHIFFRSAVDLNTDAILTLFFIPGVYYLIKFLRNKNKNHILVASIFFVVATLIKIPSVVYFPIELILIVGYLIYLKKNKILFLLERNVESKTRAKLVFSSIGKKKKVKIVSYILIPWLIFFLFWFSYNDYYYGGPFETYISNTRVGEIQSSSYIGTLFILEQKDFEQFKDYSKYLLPYQLPAAYNNASENFDDLFGKNWPGLLSPLIIAVALLLSFREKQKRLEIIVMSVFIAGILWFSVGQASEERASFGLPVRYMLPALSLSFIILSYLLVRFFQFKSFEKNLVYYKLGKIFKNIVFIGLGLFFVVAFYFTPPIQMIFSDDISFKNPQIYAERYPPDLEGITENSVIVSINTDLALAYNAIPFFITLNDGENLESIFLLKNIISEGYDVYVFKDNRWSAIEKEIWVNLTENYQIVLKDSSSTFCKMTINSANSLEQSDKICLGENMDDSDKG